MLKFLSFSLLAIVPILSISSTFPSENRIAVSGTVQHLTDSAPAYVYRFETPDNEYLKAIEIYEIEDLPERMYPPPEKPLQAVGAEEEIVIELELAEPVARIYKLIPRKEARFRVEEQVETSLSVSAEGPHLDLRDWKHWTSEWEPLKSPERNSFLAFEPTEKYFRFPSVTTDEMVAAVAAVVGKDDSWVQLARECKSADTEWCIVTISEVRLRISGYVGGVWKPIQMIRLVVPMGC